MPFPTVAPYTKFNLVLQASGGGTLGTYELLDFSGGEYKLNVNPLKPYGSNTQNFKGDETYIIENLRFTIRVTGARGAAMASLLSNLKATKQIQMGSATLAIAAGVGINSWSPLGTTSSRVEIELIPATVFWSDGGVAVA